MYSSPADSVRVLVSVVNEIANKSSLQQTEGEDRDGRDAGHRQRQHDAAQRAEMVAAVDRRAFLEVAREASSSARCASALARSIESGPARRPRPCAEQ
jgi:hypothetical protein